MKGLTLKGGFTQKLVLISALVSGSVWLLFGGVFFYVAKSSQEQQLTDYQIDMARELMQTIDRSLFTAYQGVQVVAQDRRLIDLLAQEDHERGPVAQQLISEHLEGISLLTGPWHVVSLLDVEGKVVVSNMPEGSGSAITDHPEAQAAFQAGLKNQIYHSDLRLPGERNRPSLIFAAPVHREGVDELEVIGVVIGQYAWPVISQVLDGVAPHISAQLLRNDGTVIGTRSTDTHRIGSQPAAWQALQAAGLDRRSVALDSPTVHGEPSSLMVATRQNGYLRYGGHDWVLVLETPYNVLLAPVYNLAWQLAMAALLGVLVLCGALFISGLYLTRPIGAMSRAVEAFAQGDMSARVDIDRHGGPKDEITNLAHAFNTMAQDIGYYLEQVKENSQEVRAFAYIVSHDLRAPLVNLRGFSAEIGYSLADLRAVLGPTLKALPDDEQAQATTILDDDLPEALRFIGSSVERMDGQIEAMLKLSRLGRREFYWKQVDVGAVVHQVTTSLQHQLEEKDITVDVGKLPVVEADRVALEQIFGNLLDNAVKYITEAPGKIEVWSTVDRHNVVFHIRDNGPGIDAANIPKAFELFRRVGPSETPGEGMGLAYVKTLVRRHGGSIWCRSTVGKGSTFSFSLAARPNVQTRELG